MSPIITHVNNFEIINTPCIHSLRTVNKSKSKNVSKYIEKVLLQIASCIITHSNQKLL